jgi:hypothetical protein
MHICDTQNISGMELARPALFFDINCRCKRFKRFSQSTRDYTIFHKIDRKLKQISAIGHISAA